MIQKRVLSNFISKYHLNGLIEKVQWTSDTDVKMGFVNDFLQSTNPDSQEKKAVTMRHKMTVITGNFVKRSVKFRSEETLRNRFLERLP